MPGTKQGQVVQNYFSGHYNSSLAWAVQVRCLATSKYLSEQIRMARTVRSRLIFFFRTSISAGNYQPIEKTKK